MLRGSYRTPVGLWWERKASYWHWTCYCPISVFVPLKKPWQDYNATWDSKAVAIIRQAWNSEPHEVRPNSGWRIRYNATPLTSTEREAFAADAAADLPSMRLSLAPEDVATLHLAISPVWTRCHLSRHCALFSLVHFYPQKCTLACRTSGSCNDSMYFM